MENHQSRSDLPADVEVFDSTTTGLLLQEVNSSNIRNEDTDFQPQISEVPRNSVLTSPPVSATVIPYQFIHINH